MRRRRSASPHRQHARFSALFPEGAGDVDIDGAVLDLRLVRLQGLDCWCGQGCTVADPEGCIVEDALHDVAVDEALCERRLCVRARVCRGVEGPVDVEQCHWRTDGQRDGLTGREIVGSTRPYPLTC